MKHALVAFWALLGVGLLSLLGQGPDEKYVAIYGLIQEGDAWKARADNRRAAESYRKAHSLLKEYPAAYPGWNENVVNYRLRYLAGQLEELAPYLPDPTPSNTAVASVSPPPNPASTPLQSTASLQGELERLTRINADLEAKLKEAWSVQPAAADERELAKAEQRDQELQKEIDLLRITIEQHQSVSAPVADTAAVEARAQQLQAEIDALNLALEQERSKAAQAVDATARAQEQTLIEDLKDRLRRQNELVANLRTENDNLKAQLVLAETAYRVPTDTNEIAHELLIARATIDALQRTNISLKAQTIVLETRLEELSKQVGDASSEKVKELMAERDELRQQLAIAMKQLERMKTRVLVGRADDLAQQLESVLARLDVYEAKAIPYSPEELALFRNRATNTPATVANVENITVRELPPGTGPLIAEAMHASEERRFDDAEKLYQQVLRQDENHILTLANLAMIQIKQNHLNEAEATLQRALAVDAKDPSLLFLWGHLKFEQGKYDEAFDALSRSARLKPDDRWTQYYLGQTLLMKGNLAAAETALRRALQLNPAWAEAHRALALVYAKQQPPFLELAQWHYNKALDAKLPADPELERILASASASNPNP